LKLKEGPGGAKAPEKPQQDAEQALLLDEASQKREEDQLLQQ